MKISCIVNFEEKPIKNIPYYKLLLKQITPGAEYGGYLDSWIGESAALCADGEGVISKICEGYQFVIAFYGELFEKEKLIAELSALGYCFTTGSSAELALYAYIHYGEKSPHKLSGAFSYVIYDTMRRQVFAACDGDAACPLFYTECQGVTILSSKINGILAYPDKTAQISKEALLRLLAFGDCANIFEGVRMLPPASVLKIKADGATVKEYQPEYSRNLPDEIEENAAVIDGKHCENLCETIAERIGRCRIVHTYSHAPYAVGEKYPSVHTQIPFDEQTLLWGLSESVTSCGVPVLSQTDFLLAPIFSKIPKEGFRVFVPWEEEETDMRRVFLKNEMFHPAVEESIISAEEIKSCGRINAPQQIAESFGISVNTIRVVGKFKENGDYEHCDREILKGLRRILLGIIADPCAPVLAFFDESELLRICERGFEFCKSTQEEASLVAYIIKLNIWLSKYRPRLI